MPINNSYSQTPKRIFTNKPFIKGMNYTNADLEPFVCRAVSNLELESSNSATKTRMGMNNTAIGNTGEFPCKFYDKVILFSNLISTDDYNSYNVSGSSFGIRVLKDNTVLDFYEHIITNNTEITWNGSSFSNPKGEILGDINNNIRICVLANTDNNTIPHSINSNNYTLSFLGIIYNVSNNTPIYRGIINLSYHKPANKVIIEVNTYNQVDSSDVNRYGVNLASPNPQIYKDYVPFVQHDFYKDYMGVNNSKDVKNVIAMTTVALYDEPVDPSPYATTETNAHMLYGVDKNDTSDVYVRPYYVMPNGKYGAAVTATNKFGTPLYYNFHNKTFMYDNTIRTDDSGVIGIDIPIESFSSGNNVNVRNNVSNEEVNISAYNYPDIKLLCVNKKEERIHPDYDNQTADIIFEDIHSIFNVFKGTGTGASNSSASTNTYNLTTTKTEIHEHRANNTVDATTKTITQSNIKTYISPNNSYECVTKIDSQYNIYLVFKKQFTVYSPDSNDSNISKQFSLTNYPHNMYFVYYPDHDGTASYEDDVPVSRSYDFTKTGQSFSVERTNIDTLSNNGGFIITYEVSGYIKYSNSSANSDMSNAEYECGAKNISQVTGDCIPYFDDDISAYVRNDDIYYIGKDSSSIDIYIDSTLSYTNSFTVVDTSAVSGVTVTITNTKETVDSESTGYTQLSTTASISLPNDLPSFSLKYAYNNVVYNYNTNFTTFDYTQMYNFLYNSSPQSDSVVLNITTNVVRVDIQKNFVQIVQDTNNTRNFSLPVSQYAIGTIDSSSIEVVLFEIINATNNSYAYKDYGRITAKLYSVRTDGVTAVEYDKEDIHTMFTSKALQMCNHLGHTVVWDGGSNNSLCYSMFNDQSYFPSNYVITLDNPIVYAYPHNGNLVVFTTDDIYLLHSGNVPAVDATTTGQDGAEVPFTQSLIQSNTRIGEANINTVRSIGKDIFFINNNNKGYLIKPNKYVNNASDVYMISMTNQINDLLENPYVYANERYIKYKDYYKTYIYDTILCINPITISSTDYETYKDEWLYNGTIISNIAKESIHVTDGDTIYIGSTGYRLCDIDTPEITFGKNEFIGALAKNLLGYLIDKSTDITILDSGNIDNPEYRRHLVYLFVTINNKVILVNTTMLYNGLANYFDQDNDKTTNNYFKTQNLYANKLAIANAIGLHSANKKLIESDFKIIDSIDISKLKYNSWISNTQKLYVYTTNSYVYIFQSIHLKYLQDMTIIYKYNIDSKVWTTYDVPWYIYPTDIMNDYNAIGFKILTCNGNIDINTHKGMPSIVSFSNNKQDVTNIGYTESNNTYNISKLTDWISDDINVYFDSGNQSISLMNDKLFREIKLSLGSLPDDLLTMKYSIDLYVDGKLVIPNQTHNPNIGKDTNVYYGKHYHNNPVNNHYRGSKEDVDGFQKITFFAPARGRIPRVVFSLDCKSDVNILEYAIVYMQLNAK